MQISTTLEISRRSCLLADTRNYLDILNNGCAGIRISWALRNTKTFEDGLVKVVNRGDDSDTAGVVTGALLGALYGANKIPERWFSVLKLKVEIENQYVRIMGAK